MSASHIIVVSLPSFCQKLSKSVEIWRSSDKNKFAQFFWDTVYVWSATPLSSLILSLSLNYHLYTHDTQLWLTVWRSGNALVSINEVNLRRARLVLGWVTVSGVQLPPPTPENLSQYITSHPGQLSLAIPPWVGAMSTSQRAVMLCGWGVNAGMVHEWVALAGKTVWSPCYHRPYLSTLAMGSSHNRALYKLNFSSLNSNSNLPNYRISL